MHAYYEREITGCTTYRELNNSVGSMIESQDECKFEYSYMYMPPNVSVQDNMYM